ncbi:MAG TPA: rhomboid family intramembrane serine protease [Solirubrobacteraceae bacterium]|nr:rhomboid family intramembrane serine protease [Solirubrobacteraceae bacterium]
MPRGTQILIAINVIVFLAETATGAPLGGGGGGTIWNHGALFGPALTSNNLYPIYTGTHEYWRLLTSGFIHDGILHIGINMLSLYFVGMALEPAIGTRNFVVIYMTSLLAGSFGSLLFQPDYPTIGASGAIFGVFGALIVVARYRGIPFWQSGLGFILVVNILFSLSVQGISIGGHLGGLVAGLITGWFVLEFDERRHMPAVAMAGCAAVAVASIIAALAVAGGHGLTPNGFTI